MLEIQGHTGQIKFDGELVTILRKGFLGRMSVGKGEKQIPLSSIVADQWKPAGAMVNGFIQFTVPGGNERRSKPGSSTTDAVKDENSLVFTKAQMPQFEELRNEIEAARRRLQRPTGTAAPSMADELAKLVSLHQQGILSDTELAAAKERVLRG